MGERDEIESPGPAPEPTGPPRSSPIDIIVEAYAGLLALCRIEGFTDSGRLKRTIAKGDPFRIELNSNHGAFQLDDPINRIMTDVDHLGPRDRERCLARLVEVLRDSQQKTLLAERLDRISRIRDPLRLDDKLLRSYIEAVVALDENRLFAGLAVLVKDAEHYLSRSTGVTNPPTQAELEAARECFLDIVERMKATGSGWSGGVITSGWRRTRRCPRASPPAPHEARRTSLPWRPPSSEPS
jgi:hypothetical protein